MTENNIVRAWKDPVFRSTLSAEDLATMPSHPSAAIEMTADVLDSLPETGSAMGTALCSPCPPRYCF